MLPHGDSKYIMPYLLPILPTFKKPTTNNQ